MGWWGYKTVYLGCEGASLAREKLVSRNRVWIFGSQQVGKMVGLVVKVPDYS